MTTLRMVQLANEKFAVQKQEARWGSWEFCEAKNDHIDPQYGRTWGTGHSPDMVLKYCAVDTEEKAELALSKTVKAIVATSKKQIKVTKVIKKVGV